MAQFDRIQVAQTMEATGLVPLFFHPEIEVAENILQACYNGGARVLEFTARGDFAQDVFAALSKKCIRELPGMMLGIGSVTDAGAASMYMNLGANFIVTPVFREDIAMVCNRRKVLWAPGCASLTEIAQAEERGCEIVKLFPGDMFGPGFVKAVKGPQPWTKIMPTGGVSPTEESIQQWFSAGVTCVGMGSQLISKTLIAERNFSGLEKMVREVLDMIRRQRGV